MKLSKPTLVLFTAKCFVVNTADGNISRSLGQDLFHDYLSVPIQFVYISRIINDIQNYGKKNCRIILHVKVKSL